MKLSVQQGAVRLHLYGLVRSLSYVIRLNDLKTAQHLRARLAWVLRRPNSLAKPLHGGLKELFEISGLWMRNVGNRHDSKLLIRRLIHQSASNAGESPAVGLLLARLRLKSDRVMISFLPALNASDQEL